MPLGAAPIAIELIYFSGPSQKVSTKLKINLETNQVTTTERPNSRFGQGGHVLLLRRTNRILGGHREDKPNLRRTKGGHLQFRV